MVFDLCSQGGRTLTRNAMAASSALRCSIYRYGLSAVCVCVLKNKCLFTLLVGCSHQHQQQQWGGWFERGCQKRRRSAINACIGNVLLVGCVRAVIQVAFQLSYCCDGVFLDHKINFELVCRGTAACGYAALQAVLVSGGRMITRPIPKGKQLDWEVLQNLHMCGFPHPPFESIFYSFFSRPYCLGIATSLFRRFWSGCSRSLLATPRNRPLNITKKSHLTNKLFKKKNKTKKVGCLLQLLLY